MTPVLEVMGEVTPVLEVMEEVNPVAVEATPVLEVTAGTPVLEVMEANQAREVTLEPEAQVEVSCLRLTSIAIQLLTLSYTGRK